MKSNSEIQKESIDSFSPFSSRIDCIRCNERVVSDHEYIVIISDKRQVTLIELNLVFLTFSLLVGNNSFRFSLSHLTISCQ